MISIFAVFSTPKRHNGPVAVDLLFNVLPMVCGGFCACVCIVLHYFVSFLVLQSS